MSVAGFITHILATNQVVNRFELGLKKVQHCFSTPLASFSSNVARHDARFYCPFYQNLRRVAKMIFRVVVQQAAIWCNIC